MHSYQTLTDISVRKQSCGTETHCLLCTWWRHQMETFSALMTMYSPHKGQWRSCLMFTLICAWINGWVNNHEVGDLRRHRAHYDFIAMVYTVSGPWGPVSANERCFVYNVYPIGWAYTNLISDFESNCEYKCRSKCAAFGLYVIDYISVDEFYRYLSKSMLHIGVYDFIIRASFTHMDKLQSQHGYVITCPVKHGMKLLIHYSLQRLHRWSSEMENKFHPTLYNGCNYLSMLGLKMIHVSKRCSCNRCNISSITITFGEYFLFYLVDILFEDRPWWNT